MSDNIKVVVKVRPLIARELEDKLSYQWRVKNNTLYQLDHNGRDIGTSFTFDKVYDKDTKTSDIYNDIAKPIVEAATAGFNGTIFAYGQTSSGKTYTMSGTETSPGIIPLAVYNLFEIIKSIPDRDFLVRVSYIEIYNETLKDLLNVEKKNIKVHENFQGIKVDCTEQVTTSPDEVLKYLKEGEANRQTGATNMNEESSRSHSIFQITIESRDHIEGEEEAGCVNVSTLNLVDLAGSERAGQTGATGIRFKEGTHINKSLSALALVIKQLSEDQTRHVNYRDSKLTRILQNSLGGNAKTSIICAITPAAVEETISTLQFANRAKAIKNKPEVNAVATDATMIQSLTKQLSKLQSQLETKKNLEVMLESKKNVEQDNYNLQKQIAALQRLILNGFGTRSSLDMMGTRRKLVPPRRITISTLHPIEEDAPPILPKFHTPLLKYNPMLLPSSTDFVPIQSTDKLACVSEENENRLVTPPPPDKKVNFNDEVIELDSDDDNSSVDVQTCSPYHKCYGSSKTPPCVLRKNAKLAEKNLKDIVELTEREKIYTPSVIELIEKLEQNTSVLTSLQDEVNALHKISKEKDLEIDQLRVKVCKSNEEVNNVNTTKAELETLCKEFTTKLTDWEVSYETLKNKTTRREQELLSLLEEQKSFTVNRKIDDLSRPLPKPLNKELNFMDLSKDISLVNSDNESSIVHTNDDESSQFQDLITDMQKQLRCKDETVQQLEAELLSQKQAIFSLENTSRQLQSTVDTVKEKLKLLEDENSLLKATVDTLNSTITSQKLNLESANNDIESYNSLIQELQIKLSNKERILNLNINETSIESMIANEEKFIANHENMQNIIHCFKVTLESRNKEIEALKSNFANGSSVENDLREKLAVKEKEICNLTDKLKSLENRMNDNIAVLEKLIQDKSQLSNIEHQLNCKLSDISRRNQELEKINEENRINVNSLLEQNLKLRSTISEKYIVEENLTRKNEEINERLQELLLKISSLENELCAKDTIINSFNKVNEHSNENLRKAKAVLQSIHNSLVKLDSRYEDTTDYCDKATEVFSILEDKWTDYQSKVNESLSLKEVDIQTYLELNRDLEISNTEHKTEINDLQKQLTQMSADLIQYKNLNKQMSDDHQELNRQFETKLVDHENLNSNLNDLRKDNEKLHCDILKLQSLNNEADQNHQDTENQIESLVSTIELKTKTMQGKDEEILELRQNLHTLKKDLDNKSIEVIVISQKLDETVTNQRLQFNCILEQTSKVLESLNINANDFTHNDGPTLYENVICKLQNIANHIINVSCKKCELIKDSLTATQKEMNLLAIQNEALLEKLSNTESRNRVLSLELDEIKFQNKTLNNNLAEVNKTLELLRIELKEKSTDIEIMVTKTEDLKKHFMGLDHVMQDELKELLAHNERLKIQCLELESTKSKETIQSTGDDIDSRTVTLSQYDEAYQVNVVENKSPPSLLTICCNKIVETIQPSENSISTTNSDISLPVKELGQKLCNCEEIFSELKGYQRENEKLKELLQQREIKIKDLIEEQEAVRHEVQLLLAPANELQKKINSHKTNLSTLTATTYAENKSLKSQVTVLQHHHSRFHNVCQRDLPVVKKQLYELMTILKSDNSYIDKHNASFKRYSLPSVFDSNSTLNNLKNESTLDGDLLMLDTNMTLATSTDNTLMGIDQTCLDISQMCTNNDVACQTIEHFVSNNIEKLSHIDKITYENAKLSEQIHMLKQENEDLKIQIQQHSVISKERIEVSPIKTDILFKECAKCNIFLENEKFSEEKIAALSQELINIKSLKTEFEQKYNNLILEVPSTESLIRKLKALERDCKIKSEEILKLSNSINAKNTQIKQIQQENECLSTQVMEVITESDSQAKELEDLKVENAKMKAKIENLLKDHEIILQSDCTQCRIKTMPNVDMPGKLNRSLSDSETSSRINKICTLQNELYAGREDCKELTEDVATIKNHLERNELSICQNMDLDDSMGESNIYTFKKHDSVSPPLEESNLTNNQQDRHCSDCALNKSKCINYYIEKMGCSEKTVNDNMNIVDLMKMFYNELSTKHNEVENLVNKIKCYEESKNQLEKHVDNISMEYSKVKESLELKENNFETVTNVLSQIRQNILLIAQQMSDVNNSENKNLNLVTSFKENLLVILDKEFDLSSVTVFENVIDALVTKHHKELRSITEQYTTSQKHIESLSSELSTVNKKLCDIKCQLSDKENEYNLLKVQKEKIHEISNAVTLDIIRKEQELCETIANGCKKLMDHNIMCSRDFDTTLPLNKQINVLLERILTEYNPSSIEAEKDKENLVLEINKSKLCLEESKKALQTLKVENDKLKEINETVTLDLINVEKHLQFEKTSAEHINAMYENKLKENDANIAKLNELTHELQLMKEEFKDKESIICDLKSEKEIQTSTVTEMITKINILEEEIKKVKILNEIIIKEKEEYALELENCKEAIKSKNEELDKLMSDIHVLRKSVKENVSIMENLKMEAKSLLQQNLDIKIQLEEKSKDCSRLEMNIKTHEKTAEIQSKMIIRLQKQKGDDDSTISEKNKQIEELSQQYSDLRKECEAMKNNIKESREEIEMLKNIKESIEMRLSEVNTESAPINKQRVSMEADTTRRRRQSIHDSKRVFDEDCGDHNKMEVVFDSRAKPLDFFMDVDDGSSDRSTPLRSSRGRDSFTSRHEQVDRDDDPPSRPSSVVATRRRRQSSHDLHRIGVQHTPSPHERNSSTQNNSTDLKPSDIDNNNIQSEVAQLREQLSTCQQELEELKERYREVDEECEICSQYLREREEQCLRLKKEKASLTNVISELQEKLKSVNPNRSQQAPKRAFADAFVNTDEDWTNLHSVVVDRMSFDAEVEKNKRLTKLIEELRYKKQELKNVIAKMQKALDRNLARDNTKELEVTKAELKACKQEVKELRENYKKLGAEYDSCAQYLGEMDEHCRKLKEAKAVLEVRKQSN
ncbi:unnamed protein product [Chilo suppressalis]|uniref:Kinesin motor domain-containing protein n=1 Tax=Chilo suppressalis TaxID=168631 RepID=A0ABN8E9I0_CHISP|nr:unnamed protein product [Chilo suppressalis]